MLLVLRLSCPGGFLTGCSDFLSVKTVTLLSQLNKLGGDVVCLKLRY